MSEFWRSATHVDGAPAPRSAAVESGRGRLAGLSAVFLVAFGALCWRLIALCLVAPGGHDHQALAGGPPYKRADIVDQSGELLARDLTMFDISLNPSLLTNPSSAAEAVARALPKLDTATLRKRFTSGRSFVYVLRDATPKDADAIHSLGLPGVNYKQVAQRAYPQGKLFSHVLGFVNVDNKGIAGLELSEDDLLRSRGETGSPLRLSVDMQIQYAVRDVIAHGMAGYGAEGGVGIVMDVSTGEILSLVSLPDFDPNRAGDATDEMMRNRATSSLYEMGSTFKPFTFAIGFETNTLKLSDRFDATHPLEVAGRKIKDYHPENRWLTATEVFVHSSNIGAAKMALRFGPEKQREYLQAFGLLSPSPIELPEVTPPLVQSRWGPVETATIAYGYGLEVSPIQLASGIATLVNGGYYVAPTLIKRGSQNEPPRRQVVSARTCELIRQLLRVNVEGGTGRSAAVPGYDVGGKTGTANKHEDGSYTEDARIASFAAVFPTDAPRYLVLVMLDDPVQVPGNVWQPPTGGATAAPLSGLIIRRIAPMLGMPPVGQQVNAQEVRTKKL